MKTRPEQIAKISVIVPVYNTQIYLEQCLKSLESQTLKEIEIICVNDGSTDDSAKILSDFAAKDSRFKIIHQENKGQSAARNTGIGHASGEYIGFLDSDDWANPDMFEKLYTLAKTHDSDISMCSITVFNEKTGEHSGDDPYMSLRVFPNEFEHRSFSFEETYDYIFRICVVPWNKIYKADYIKNFKFLEGLIFEDILFFLETFIDAKRVSIIKENLVNYRFFSETSCSSVSNNRKIPDLFIIFEHIEKLLKEKKLYPILGEYFQFFKKSHLEYWYGRMSDDEYKTQYKKRLDKLYPNNVLGKIKTRFKEKRQLHKLNKLLKTKKVLFWGASGFLKQFIINNNINSQNIAGITDASAKVRDTFVQGYTIFPQKEMRALEFDCVVPSAVNIYNFDKMIKTELSNLGITAAVEKIF